MAGGTLLLFWVSQNAAAMKDIDQRIAVVLGKITEKLTSVPAEDLSVDDDDQADAFIMLNKKLNDLVRFHRSFVKLQYGEEEIVYRAVCFVEEVMLPSISGPELSGNWFHYTLQTLINIARPIKGPEGSEAYRYLDDVDDGVQRMREMSLLS
jgi:hypothetical protein